jgi:hypothetical protein
MLTVMSAKYMIASFTATEQIKSQMKSDAEKVKIVISKITIGL